MIKQFYGVNITVRNLEAAVKKYGTILGVPAKPTLPSDFAFPGLQGASFQVDQVAIQIISSDDPETSIYKFVKSRGEGVSLISLRVDDLEKAIQGLTVEDVTLVCNKPLTCSSGEVNFGHPKSLHGAQIEFMELDKQRN
jgi:methylmalonyl-CoA/ethylmalonyl-CoA epimerase